MGQCLDSRPAAEIRAYGSPSVRGAQSVPKAEGRRWHSVLLHEEDVDLDTLVYDWKCFLGRVSTVVGMIRSKANQFLFPYVFGSC